MQLEALPLIVGGLIGLIGLAVVLDSLAPDYITEERRRLPRRKRSRFGEFLLGLAVLAMAAAFLGRDEWRYSTATVIAGSALLLLGVWSSAGYLRDLFAREARRRTVYPEGSRRIR